MDDIFFFQAEDGIRDIGVTGVQTCALPICSREEPFIVDASEPPVLFGHNEAPNPAEYYLHALAGCMTLTIVNVAAARKVELYEVTSTLTGVLDARGATGIDDSYRNGFERIDVTFHIKGDASPEKLQEIVERAKARSVVYD